MKTEAGKDILEAIKDFRGGGDYRLTQKDFQSVKDMKEEGELSEDFPDLGVDFESRLLNAKLRNLEARTDSLVEGGVVSRRLRYQECLEDVKELFLRVFENFRNELITCRLNVEQCENLQSCLGECLDSLSEGIDDLVNAKSGESERECK